jgi:tetratricopeptide (TPR) repeat protein
MIRAVGVRMLVMVGLVLAGLAGPSVSAQAPGTTMALLDRYARGEFAAVATELENVSNFKDLYQDLVGKAPVWLAAGGPADRPRRELAAATFALEAARAGEWQDWKLVRKFMSLDNIYWSGPPLLIEFGCELFRKDARPRPVEHLWQQAALAVAERAEDFEFLIGSPFDARANPKDEIDHLKHVAPRFPDDKRFALAQGIALEWRTFPSPRALGQKEALAVFNTLKDDGTVGGEASARLGVLQFRQGAYAAALKQFERVDDLTRDPYVLFIARLFQGQALERLHDLGGAERAYRGALLAVPRAQSATFAAAALMSKRGERAEGAALIDASLTAPLAIDPWRGYADADDRFWPELIAKLHAEILAPVDGVRR